LASIEARNKRVENGLGISHARSEAYSSRAKFSPAQFEKKKIAHVDIEPRRQAAAKSAPLRSVMDV
jgi:hypothetical protein